jgi:large subunit ribosomal protein L14
MIFIQTKLEVADNSGALVVRCIKILNNKLIGTIGSLILVAIQKINPKKKILKGSIYKCVIVRLKRKVIRNGGYISINENAVVILNNNLMPIATRIFGPVLRELRLDRKYSKIISLAKFVI